MDTDNSIFMYLCFSKTPAFSPGATRSGRSTPKSDGMMVGEGIGMMLLKRLADAERDGDRVYAVIRGIGTSSDGQLKSIYAPRPEGQMLALQRAYAGAGSPRPPSGWSRRTAPAPSAGDLAEVTALCAVFARGRAPNRGSYGARLGQVADRPHQGGGRARPG